MTIFSVIDKWQGLVGSILGGVFAFLTAVVVAKSSSRRDEIAAAMIVLMDVQSMRVRKNAIDDLLKQEGILPEDYSLRFSEKFVEGYHALSPLFNESMSKLLHIDVALSAHLALFLQIYNSMSFSKEQRSKDYEWSNINKDIRRSEEAHQFDATIIYKHMNWLDGYTAHITYLVNIYILDRFYLFYRVRRRFCLDRKEKEAYKILKNPLN